MITFLFFAICAVLLLLLPFVPAWQEWRHPTDDRPLPVPHDTDSAPDHFAQRARASRWAQDVECSAGDLCCAAESTHRALLAHGEIELRPGARVLEWAHADGVIRLGPGCVGLRRLTAGQAIELARNCCFERLHAPLVRFGAEPEAEGRAGAPQEPGEQPWSVLPGAQLARVGCWFFDGDCDVPSGTSLRGSAVVAGALRLGTCAVVHGDVKARKGMVVGIGSHIDGAATCEQDIHFLEGSSAAGPVISEQGAFLAARVRIGAPEALTTLSAATVVAEAGAQVHGTAWARQVGVVWAAA